MFIKLVLIYAQRYV
uniref:Uncharacterized protein n=1 Tax=Anguilla anguilla TaxID=7936 RepID=A0A0E9VT80_ANGAN